MLWRDNFLQGRHQFCIDNHKVKDLNHSLKFTEKNAYIVGNCLKTDFNLNDHKGVKYGF